MHEFELAVHPWELQDDHLKYNSTKVWDEAQLYVDKGVDGLFVEFPHTTFTMFQAMGTKAGFPMDLSEFTQWLFASKS